MRRERLDWLPRGKASLSNTSALIFRIGYAYRTFDVLRTGVKRPGSHISISDEFLSVMSRNVTLLILFFRPRSGNGLPMVGI